MNNGYFISTNNMVDPSRVYCQKCGAQAEEKGGTWFATNGQNKEMESFNGNENNISKNNLCPDCVETVLIEAINKGGCYAKQN
jgi:ribosomal protein S27AE